MTLVPQSPLVDGKGDLLPTWGFLAFHQSLRRDASRFAAAAGQFAVGSLPDTAVDGIRVHWGSYRALLDFHHTTEDEHLFPVVRAADPKLGPLIDELAAQHDQLHLLLDRITNVMERLERPGTASEAVEVFTALEALLGPHLDAEEDHLVPVILAMVADQAEPSDAAPPDAEDGPPSDAAEPVAPEFGHPWSMEHLDDETLERALATLPASEREQYPGWLRTYRERLSVWVGDPRTGAQ